MNIFLEIMMSSVSFPLILLLVLSSLSEDTDDNIEGPIMPLCEGRLCDTVELITAQGGKGERHTVTADDGYLLTVFRVVAPKQPASVVLLQHGFLCSSDCWVTDPQSLAHKLSGAGYDVWINNARGNAYSRGHTTLKPEDKEFWNFSWHEMATKDLPAVVHYVLNVTGQSKLHLVGHSLGSVMALALASTLPQYNQQLKSLTALAPTVFLSRMVELVGPGGMGEETARKHMDNFQASGKVEVFPRKDLSTNEELQITCNNVDESFKDMCSDTIEHAQKVLGGAYLPAGQSLKTLDHLYQMSTSGVMQYYNMSGGENKAAYGSENPPVYTDKFSEISTPTLIWSAENDGLVTFKDIDVLVPLLPNLASDNRIKEECFDHVAFIFPRSKSCITVRERVYSDILEALKKLD